MNERWLFIKKSPRTIGSPRRRGDWIRFRPSASPCLRRPAGLVSEASPAEGDAELRKPAWHEIPTAKNASYPKGTTDVELRSTY